MSKEKWGFLRETSTKATNAGIDQATGLHRTGLDIYLGVIFPETNDWVNDKAFGWENDKYYRIRPDYISESLKLIVEFDGLQHYQSPEIIEKDMNKTTFYESSGYKVVRIPYFIQLTNKAVKTLFDVDISEPLFNIEIPSLSIEGKNTPAFLCPAGIIRMAQEFTKFPIQYQKNVNFLKQQNNPFKSGVEFLEKEYERFKSKINAI